MDGDDLLAEFDAFDDADFLNAYVHTFKPYSHGVTLDRYVNNEGRQLSLEHFARFTRNRIEDIIDRDLILLNITLQFIGSNNTPIYRTMTPDMLAHFDDLEALMEEDDTFAQMSQSSDNSSADDGIAYHLSTRYLEVSSAGHVGGGNVKTAVFDRFVSILNTSRDGFDCAFDCFAYVLERLIENIPKIRNFLKIKPCADVPYGLIPKIARLLRK